MHGAFVFTHLLTEVKFKTTPGSPGVGFPLLRIKSSLMYRPTRPQWRIQKIVHSCYGGGEVVLDAVHASPDLGGQNVLKTL